jgi:hypothetical protein
LAVFLFALIMLRLRWSLLMALSGQSSRAQVCPLLEQQRTKTDFGPRWFVSYCPKADIDFGGSRCRTARNEPPAAQFSPVAFCRQRFTKT